jgi:Fe-S-cluster containining protein
MKSPCCRLINLISKNKLELIKNGVESDGIFRSNSQKDIKNETNFGWDMTNEAEGYPCERLGVDGCRIYEVRPDCCHNFPNSPKLLSKLPTCSISFNDKGEKIGTCNRCDSK